MEEIDRSPDDEMRTKNRFSVAFKYRPIEMLAAFGLLVGGLAMSMAGEEAWWQAGGAGLTALGGILFSWSMATLNSREQAAVILQPQLETTSKHLGTVSGQIAQTIQAVHSGAIDPDTGFALMLQSNGTLYNLVSDLQRLTGTQFDSTDLLDTIERLDELAGKVSRIPEYRESQNWEQEETIELQGEIEALKSELRSQLTKMGRSSQVRQAVDVTCPSCTNKVAAQIGTHPGATALSICPICAARYNVHRRGDGSTIVKLPKISADFSDDSSQESYERIIERQGVKLPSPKLREIGCVALAKAFEMFEENRAPSWDDLEVSILRELKGLGVNAELTDAKRIRQLGYRTRIYDLDSEKGIGLKEGLTEDTVYEAIAQNLASRIHQNLDEDFDPKLLAELLYNDSRRTDETSLLIKRLSRVKSEDSAPVELTSELELTNVAGTSD